MHLVTASIYVKFWEIKEDIGISKRTTSHFRISYRSRDICLDYGSFINLSGQIVSKFSFTEKIICKMIQFQYSVDFTSYGACKSLF